MKAFYKVENQLIKAYDMGDDWRLIDSDGVERWFSKWQNDEHGSLRHAFVAFVGCFDGDKLIICE